MTGRSLDIGRIDAAETVRLLDRLGARAARGSFAEHGARLPEGWGAARQATRDALGSAGAAWDAILGRPVDRGVAKRPYVDLGEGDLVSRAFVARNLPFLAD